MFGGEASSSWEVLSALPALRWLTVGLPDGGRDLSFLAHYPLLTGVILNGCTALSDLSALVSASQLRSVYLRDAKQLRDLRAFIGLPNLERLGIDDAPLTDGLAAVTPVLDRLKELDVWRVPTVTSLQAVVGSSLQEVNLADCPITDLAPLATLQSLTLVWLRDFSAVDLAPLATLPHLRELVLDGIDEPVDLSPLARTDHRLRVVLWKNTSTVGTAGPLVKIRRH
jgi:internalin A